MSAVSFVVAPAFLSAFTQGLSWPYFGISVKGCAIQLISTLGRSGTHRRHPLRFSLLWTPRPSPREKVLGL